MIELHEIQKVMSDLKYEMDHHDSLMSDRGSMATKVKSLMEPCYVHLWMILYPLKGQEYTIPTNIGTLSAHLHEMVDKCLKVKLPLLSTYINCNDQYLRRVKSELVNHHGYSNLNGVKAEELNKIMNDIYTEISHDVTTNRKKDKDYVPTAQRIQEIIKEQCEVK